MALFYLLDEHLRGGALWQAIQDHNALGVNPLDVVRVGDPPDLPLGSLDPVVLLWTERENRILVTWDRQTIPGHLADHLHAGHHCPGIFIIRNHSYVLDVVFSLVLADQAGNPADYRDRIEYIPW